MSLVLVLLSGLVLGLGAGCAIGMGPSTAATRPLLGQTMRNDDAQMWVVSSDQSNVPGGLVRVEQVSDGFARVFNYVSITSAVKKGSAMHTLADGSQSEKEVLELDLALTGRIPLPIGGISIGLGHVSSYEDRADLSGVGVRASFAPIGQLSIDVAHSWVSGPVEDAAGAMTDVSGTRTSLGGTVLLWGYNQFRFGIAVAKTWNRADPYASEGYTYSLVSTMY